MGLVVVVTIDLMVENALGVVNVGDIFAHTGSNKSILEPPVGAFDFALCLGGERVGDFNVAVVHHLFPLGGPPRR